MKYNDKWAISEFEPKTDVLWVQPSQDEEDESIKINAFVNGKWRVASGGKSYPPEDGIPVTDLDDDVQSSLSKADTAYQKPTTGIPAGDLASGVQTSLGKADTALQTIKTVNGQSLVGSGDIEILEPGTIETLVIDGTPTAGSSNLITSGGVEKYLAKTYTDIDVSSASASAGAMRITNGVVAFSPTDDTYRTVGLNNPIHLLPGDVLIINNGDAVYANSMFSVVTKVETNSGTTSYTCLVQGSGRKTYSYLAPEEMDVLFCCSGSGYPLKVSHLEPAAADGKTEELLETYNKTLLFERNESPVDTNINSTYITTNLPDGAKLEIDITEVAGSSNLEIQLYSADNNSPTNLIPASVGKYYIEKKSGLYKIRLQKLQSEGNNVKFKIYEIAKYFPVTNREIPSFLFAKQIETIPLGQPFQGYHTNNANDAENTITNVGYWVSFPIQKTNGFTIKIEFDSSAYVVLLKAFSPNYQKALEWAVTSGTNVNLGLCSGWSLCIRRKDYTAITPAEATNLITVTKVDGVIYQKPTLPYEVEKIVEDKLASYNPPAIQEINTEIESLNTKVQRNRLGTLTIGKWLHHLNVEASQSIIPSQSLFDIAYAKALGFKMIEANLQVCSDGVTVIKHGAGNKLGAGLIFADGSGLTSDTLFSAITSTTLRQNVTYDSPLAKYQGHIPTLDEFCSECAKLGMIAFLRGCNASQLAIARKYLPDERIIVEGLSQRGDFKGYMTVYANNETAQNILNACNAKGQPFYYAWSVATSASDELFTEVAQTLHSNGYHLAAAYVSPNKVQDLAKIGLDIVASTNGAIPPFESGNHLNIVNGGDSHLTLTNATYDSTTDTTSMQNGGTIVLSDAIAGASLAKVSVKIRYNGTLTIIFGQVGNTYRDLISYESDGTSEMELACACPRYGESPFVNIKANGATTIYDLKIALSII